MYCDRRGNGQKPTRTKTPQKKRNKIFEKFFLCVFFLRHTKNRGGGGPRCVTYFWEVPGCVTKCDRGGSKLTKSSMTYFMDGPDANSVMIPVNSSQFLVKCHFQYSSTRSNLTCLATWLTNAESS